MANPNTDLGFAINPWTTYENPNGINGGDGSTDGGYIGRLNLLQRAGFQWVRMDMPYDNSSRHAEMDNMVNDAIARGFKIIAIAEEGPGGTQAFSGGIANWVNTILNHYGTKISAIEFGNELNAGNKSPDYSGTGSGQAPSAFAPIMKQAFDACRNNVNNPNVVVLVGSVCSHGTNDSGGLRPADWWTQFIANAKNFKTPSGQFPWDAAAIHPYSDLQNGLVDPSTDRFTGGVPGVVDVHNVMAGQGDPGVLWGTEFGFRSHEADGSQSPGYNNIATWFTHMINGWRGLAYTGPFMAFTLDGPNYSTEEGRMGVIAPNNGSNISTVTQWPWYATLTGLVTTPGPPPVTWIMAFSTIDGVAPTAASGGQVNVGGSEATLRGDVSVVVSVGASDGSPLTVKLTTFNGDPSTGQVLNSTGGSSYSGTFDTRTLPNGNNAFVVQAWTNPANIASPTINVSFLLNSNVAPRGAEVTQLNAGPSGSRSTFDVSQP